MLQTMYFDLGNVIVFFDHEKMYARLSSLLGLEKPILQKLFLEDGYVRQYETGRLSTEQFYSLVKEKSPNTFSLEEFRQAACSAFRLNEEILPVIDDLLENNIQLILLSNTSECHFSHIQKTYPVLQKFHHFVLSYEAGYCKPDPLIYETALKLAYGPPSSCFFVDDIPEFVQGALAAGLDSAVFSDVATLKKELSARDLKLSF